MSRSNTFSVIIPTYNRINLLKHAIRSVQAQTRTNYELIVVDDGSTDGTFDYLLSLGNRVKALHQSQKGPGAARNFGAQHAMGNYLAFLDSDDVWFPWTLATFDQLIERYHQPALLSAATMEFEGEVPVTEWQELAAELFCDYFSTANSPAYVGSGALVIKRETFLYANGFDENLLVAEDLDFYFRVGAANDFVRVISPVTLAYRRHCGNISAESSALYDGAVELLTHEAKGIYPGGELREKERWELLTRMARPIALSCLNNGLEAKAWNLYRKSFKLNVRLGRVRFLTGFLLVAALARAVRWKFKSSHGYRLRRSRSLVKEEFVAGQQSDLHVMEMSSAQERKAHLNCEAR